MKVQLTVYLIYALAEDNNNAGKFHQQNFENVKQALDKAVEIYEVNPDFQKLLSFHIIPA